MEEKYKSHLKRELGKVTSKNLKKAHDAKNNALKAKIEDRRKAGEEKAERERTGNSIFK